MSRSSMAGVSNEMTTADGGGDHSQTVAALPTILRTLKARGYAFYRLWCS